MHTRLLFFDVVSTLVINLMSVKECNFFISERLWTVTGLKNLYIWAFFFQILLEVKKIFEKQQSMVEISIPEVSISVL